MHAMMEPEQILEHAKAAEAAGAHRFCMVTQGQGLSKRDFAEDPRGRRTGRRADQPEALRLDRPHVGRAGQGAEARRASSGSTTTSSRRAPTTPRSPSTVRYEGRLRTIEAVKEAGPGDLRRRHPQPRREPTSSGSRWPSSCPRSTRPRCRSTCSTRARGPSSATATLMDPWEVVKWIAIFRLIIPGALFRLCGGRVENLGELQPLAVKAGPQRGDDGQLPHHPRRRARGRPGDVRGARAERRPPARQRRQPAARQPLRLARGRDAGDADGRADRPPGRGQLLGSLDPAAGGQEGQEAAALPDRGSAA